jgi:hypothetical protein
LISYCLTVFRCLANRIRASLTTLITPFKKKKQQQKEFKSVGFADLDDTSSLKKGEKKPRRSGVGTG